MLFMYGPSERKVIVKFRFLTTDDVWVLNRKMTSKINKKKKPKP